MSNRDVEAAWEYHNSTKHSYQSVRSNPHYLDWANQPRTYKIYRGLEPIFLPRDMSVSRQPALSVLGPSPHPSPAGTPVTLEELAATLFLSAGITRRHTYQGGEILFRAAACTGALYAIELYVVCGEISGLDAGIYLFNPLDFSLLRVRAGDHRNTLVHAAAREKSVMHAPVTIVCTGTYWRNAWKYQARTYRHFGWDNGTILANLLAAAAARGLPARVVTGFIDEEVNRLLDLDADREVALTLVPLGYSARSIEEQNPEVPPLHLETAPYSPHEVDYPAMRKIHAASCLVSQEEVAAWRGHPPKARLQPASGELVPLKPFSFEEMPKDSLDEVIRRRGSTRRFARQSISFQSLSTVLIRATQGVPADFLDPYGAQINDIYVVAHAVQGLGAGSYVLHPESLELELLQGGTFRGEVGYMGLEQDLPADSSAAVFFVTDLNPVLDRFGNRGYRAAQLEAGIIGGRLYLGSYAQRLGATGLTFYDDEVIRFFSPHAEGKSAIFLVALGKPARRILG
jgi:SagB-type dehydrogenase family enzyme